MFLVLALIAVAVWYVLVVYVGPLIAATSDTYFRAGAYFGIAAFFEVTVHIPGRSSVDVEVIRLETAWRAGPALRLHTPLSRAA